MTWYNNNPKWRQFIQKDYTIQSLLLNKDQIQLVKELPLQLQLQNYVRKHRVNILQDSLRFCLEYPQKDSSYDRKFMYPTRAIELLTNEIFFSHLSWDRQLIRTYLSLLVKNLATVDPHYENINIYHGYFQRLFKMLTRNSKNFMKQILEAIVYEEKNGNFIGLLMKYSHKLSIVTCLYQLLIIDLTHLQQMTLLSLKQSLMSQIMKLFAEFVAGKPVQEQQVQNCLIIIKMYLEECFHYTKDKNNPFHKQNIASFNAIGLKLIANWSTLVAIITKRQENCLKLKVFEILQVYEMQKEKLHINGFLTLAPQAYKQQLIQDMLARKFGIAHSHFYEWLIIAFSNLGQNDDQITLFIQRKIIQRVLSILLEHKNNNILSFRIFVLLKMIFVNIQKEIQLKISRHVNTGCDVAQFRLFNEFFKHFSTIENTIKSFKSYNQCLFIHMVVAIKFFSESAHNIINNFNNFSSISACNSSKPALQHLIEFYQKQPCFRLYQTEISKDLGTFFTDEVFKDKIPLQYQVKKINQQPQKNIQKENQLTQKKPENNFAFNQKEKVAVPQIQNTLIQLKFDNTILEVEPILEFKVAQNVLSDTEVLVNEKENEEDLDRTYQNYLKRNMQQVESIVENKRSKSRTPTKMKNDVKKSKNRWLDQSNVSNSSTQSNPRSSEDKVSKTILKLSPQITKKFSDSKLPLISLIKVSKKNLQKKQNKQRQLDIQRDSRLYNWLNLLKQMR